MNRIVRHLLTAAGVVAMLPSWAAAQEGATVTGRVTSQFGVPLLYANVVIEELGVGTLTRDDGRYSIEIPAGRVLGQQVTLSVRLLGYKQRATRIALVPGAITQDFELAVNPLQLGEVVVTGEGTARAVEKLGTVRTTVDSLAIRRSSETNIVNALAAKAPNVEVVSQSGEPGASAFIRIRGQKTILGTGQPLFVVDGAPIDNSTLATGSAIATGTVAPNRASDINPDDIESIEILKGAAAAAIYGARAGQGVILITTKSGSAGPTRYSLRSTVTADRVSGSVPLQLRFGQGVGGAAVTCTAPNCLVAVGNAVSFGPELGASIPAYNHFEELFETGLTADNTLTISGGNDRTTFYLSGEYMNNTGVIIGPNDEYQRSAVRVKGEHRVLDNLRVGGNVSYADTRGSFIQKGSNTSGLLLGGMRTPPNYNNFPYLDPVSDMHRSYRFPNPTPASVTLSRGYDNPLFVAFETVSNGKVGRVFGNVNAEYLPVSWLQVNYTLGADFYSDTRLQGFPQTSSTFPTGRVQSWQFSQLSVNHNLLATATYRLNPNVSGTFTLGQALTATQFRQVFVQGNTLLAPRPFKLQNTVDRSPPTDAETNSRLESYFGQLTVDLWNQLYLTGALRNDGSSTFGIEEDKRHWFPKASVAWDFTGAAGREWLSFGKLRAAYGQMGQTPPAYLLQSVLVSGGSFTDGGWGPNVTATQGGRGGLFTSITAGQPLIKPERTEEFEAGIDLAVLNDRADVHVTHYRATSKDVIFSLPVAPSTGFGEQAQNAAEITNRGWEVILNLRPVATAEFDWNIGLQWARNRNLVEDLRGAAFVGLGPSFAGIAGSAFEGHPIGVFRGNDFARCGRELVIGGVDIDAACGNAPAGALYIAADGFPVVDPSTRVIGDPQTDWTGSIQSALRYKKWRLSGLLDIRQGGQIWNGTKGALFFFGTHAGTLVRNETMTYQEYARRGLGREETVAGPGASTAVLIDENWFLGQGGGFGSVSAQFVEDASFVKLREISLAYTLDQRFVRETLGFSSIDLRVAGRNLVTWTDYTGQDPETNLAGAEGQVRGYDFFNNPQTRSFVFSITLNR